MFTCISFPQFFRKFQTDDDCKAYLFYLKWHKGFNCSRCNHQKYWKGRLPFHVRCCACGFDESVCSRTIFSRIKFPLVTAFQMAFKISTCKSGISSLELSREFGINSKTAWLFKRKVQESMGMLLSRNAGRCEERLWIDGLSINRGDINLNGIQKVSVRISNFQLDNFPAVIYRFEEDYKDEKISCNLSHGKFIDQGADLRLWNFKVWLMGVHHHCSAKYLQGYLYEFFFRSIFHKNPGEAFYWLISGFLGGKSHSIEVNGHNMDNRGII